MFFEKGNEVFVGDTMCLLPPPLVFGEQTSPVRLGLKGSSEENRFHICVRVCGVEGRCKSLSGQFFFVCERDDREESSTKSLGGMTRHKDDMGSQIISSKSYIPHPILVYLSRNNNSQAQARRFAA